jgi:O-antigen ligase
MVRMEPTRRPALVRNGEALAAMAPGMGPKAFRRAPSALAINTLILYLVLEYARPLFLAQLKLQMLVLLIIPAMWLATRDRPWSRILTAQALFVLACLIEIPIADNYYAAYFTSRTMVGHFAIGLGLSWLLAYRGSFQRVTWSWVLLMGYIAIYGILHGGVGPGGLMGDENDLALGCVTAFPLAFFGFERLSGRTRWLSGAIAGLLVVGVVVSFSRGGFLGLVAAALYCLLASRHRVRSVVILTLAATMFVVLAPNEGRRGRSYIDEIKSIAETDQGTAKGRRFLWRAAINMWKAHPILGVGGGNFSFKVGQYQPTDADFDEPEYRERDWSGMVTHSLYFQVLAEHGTVGILLLAYIILAHFRILRRLRRDVRYRAGIPPDLRRDAELYAGGLAGGVAAYCVAGAFLSVAYYPYLWYFSAMAVALDVAVRREFLAADRGIAATPPPPTRLATDGVA